MTNFGFKVSLPGKDVETATPEECSVHSSYPSPKIKLGTTPAHYGTLGIFFNSDTPAATNTIVHTISHGYDYVPMFLCAGVHTTGGGLVLQGTLPIEPTATFGIYSVADDQNCYIYVYREAGWGSIIGDSLRISYYIFAESIDE